MEQPVPLTEKRNCVYNPEKANQIKINKVKEERHDNYKNVSNYNDVSLDIQTQSGTISQQPTANSQQPTANSQQPTANSQQPTANSQQVIFTVIILYFVIYILRTRAVSDFFRLLFFYALLAVRLRSLTGRQKEILKQVQDDRSHTDYFDKLS